MKTKKRAPGMGTVQFHEGRWRLRLPPQLNPSRPWLKKTFPEDQEELAHRFLDDVVTRGRAKKSTLEAPDGVSLRMVWPDFVRRAAIQAKRKRGSYAVHKTRARLEGMGANWLSKSPFWQRDLTTVGPSEFAAWLEDVRMNWTNARGDEVSDSWVNQMGTAIRAVHEMLGLPCPPFRCRTDRGLATALNLEKQRRFFCEVLENPADRVMAGCQMGAGLRVGELLSLTVDRVHVDTRPHLEVSTGGPHGAKTKSGRPRRVELVEPGLGFFRIALQHHYKPNEKRLLFAGPQGGYLSAWPEQFVAWSEIMGERVTSHVMRHTWAYSMLSGLWGYAPQDITFVSRQLGHADIKTTQQAYGHWDPGAGLATARLLRGESSEERRIITAEWLLGQEDSPPSLRSSLPAPKNSMFSADRVSDGNSTIPRDLPAFLDREGYLLACEATRALVRAVQADRSGREEAEACLLALGDDIRVVGPLLALREGDPTAIRQTADLMRQVLAEWASEEPWDESRDAISIRRS